MASRTLHVLHFNDVYHVDDFQGKSERAVRMLLAMQPHVEELQPLITFGGDLLAPSLMSSLTKGKHMVEALELLGAHVGTLGNHDFDFGIDRVRHLTTEAALFDFEGAPRRGSCEWVTSNISGLDGEAVAGARRYVMKEWQGVRVGVIAVSEDWLADAGLGQQCRRSDKFAAWEDEVACARAWAAHVRREGAELVLCLCHDLLSNTRRLADEVPEVDFFLGGHEHLYAEGDRFVIAGFDFDDFCVLTFEVPPAATGLRPGPPRRRRVRVAADAPGAEALRATRLAGRAAAMRRLVQHYGRELEAALGRPLGCGLSAELDARKFWLRTQESAAGDLFADAVLGALREKGAECCLLIAGQISPGPGRTPAGPLTLGHVVQWFPWEGGTCVLEVAGATLLAALEHGVSRLPRRYGMFPQVSGMRFAVTVDAGAAAGAPGSPGHRVSAVEVQGEPLDAQRMYRVATGEYVADGGDDYGMLAAAPRVVGPEAAPLLHDAVVDHLKAQGPEVAVPGVQGRIRHTRAFRMYCESAEIGATPMDPALEDLMVPAWGGSG